MDDDGHADFRKIQDAINAASAGDTVFVRNGAYSENIIVNKTVTLLGESKQGTTIKGYTTGIVVTVRSINVKVSQFTVMSDNIPGNIAIHLDTVTGCQITDNIIVRNYAGVRLIDSSHNTISGNEISDIWYFYAIHLIDSSDNTINGNTLLSSHHGVYLERSHGNSINNNYARNNRAGFFITYSSNTILTGNTAVANLEYGILLLSCRNTVLRNNNQTDNAVNFGVWGRPGLLDFIQDIDTSNTINGRPIYYLVNQHDINIPSNAGYVAAINCTRISVKNLELERNHEGVLFANTEESVIENATISRNWNGIYLFRSTGNTIHGNWLESNENYNIYSYYSSDNAIYHNNLFGDSGKHAYSEGSFDMWDNGAEGNYWIDYFGSDNDHDGIGDTPYIIDDYNRDNYPLMNPWPRHDLAITKIAPYKTIVGQGYSTQINVTIINQGYFDESELNVTLFADPNPTVVGDEIQVDRQSIALRARESKTLQFVWNTSDFAKGSYTIWAVIEVASGETDTVDNTLDGGWLIITITGDTNGDGIVNNIDLYNLSKAFAATPGSQNWNPNCDLNEDHKIDTSDLSDLSNNYGKST